MRLFVCGVCVCVRACVRVCVLFRFVAHVESRVGLCNVRKITRELYFLCFFLLLFDIRIITCEHFALIFVVITVELCMSPPPPLPSFTHSFTVV